LLIVTLAPPLPVIVTGKWVVAEVDDVEDEPAPHAMSAIPMAATAGCLM
jgi:hypothetical protein